MKATRICLHEYRRHGQGLFIASSQTVLGKGRANGEVSSDSHDPRDAYVFACSLGLQNLILPWIIGASLRLKRTLSLEPALLELDRDGAKH